MLRHTTSTPHWWPDRAAQWQRGLQVGLNSMLARYLLVAAIVCALGCIYLWQANSLSELHDEIAALERDAIRLERENVRLAEQAAQWNAPSYIERRMRELGYVTPQSVVYAPLPTALVQPEADSLVRQVAQSPGSR